MILKSINGLKVEVRKNSAGMFQVFVEIDNDGRGENEIKLVAEYANESEAIYAAEYQVKFYNQMEEN